MDHLIKPIERDEAMDHTYIPLPGGWEVQTKGKGSTFRWRKVVGCCTDGPEIRHDTMADEQDAAEIESTRRAIEAWNTRAPNAAAEERDAPCAWEYDENSDAWDSACGEKWQFTSDGPAENNARFCHGCGHRIELPAPPVAGGGE